MFNEVIFIHFYKQISLHMPLNKFFVTRGVGMSSASCAPVLSLAFLAVLLGPAGCADKVQLNFYSESLCPDCIAYANGPLDKAIKEARDCVDLATACSFVSIRQLPS